MQHERRGNGILQGQLRPKTKREEHGLEEGEMQHSQRVFWSYETENENR